MKKTILTILFVILFLFGGVVSAADALQSVLDARESVVRIEVKSKDNSWHGSGFAIGADGVVEYIVTNKHIANNEEDKYTVFYGNYASAYAKLLFVLPEADLAVLKLDSPVYGVKPLTLYDGEVQELAGQQVYALGFPDSADLLFEKGERVAEDVTVTDGIVGGVRKRQLAPGGKSAVTLQINASLFNGNSGGPLVKSDGVAVGVSTFGSSEDSNMNAAISVNELFLELEKHHIPYAVSSERNADGGIGWMIPVVVVTAVTIAIVLVYIFRKKKKDGQGRTLADYLKSGMVLPEFDAAMEVLEDVLHQVVTLERKGIFACSLYPDNLVIPARSRKAVWNADAECALQAGYSAPEQYRAENLPGGWTDVYQLAAVLLHLLSGKRPADVVSRYEKSGAVQEQIDTLQIEDGKKEVLNKALSLQSGERYLNTRVFAEALGVSVPETAENLPEQAKRITPKRKRMFRIIAVIAVCAALAGVFFLYQVGERNKAVGLLDEYKFREAGNILDKIPAFAMRDMDELRAYADAGALYEDENYEAAQVAFEELGDYAAASGLAQKSKIYALTQKAARLIRDGEYEDGETIYVDLKTKADAEEQQELDYMRASAYLYAENYEKAEELFHELGDYGDAQQKVYDIALVQGMEEYERGEYFSAYEQLSPYMDKEEAGTLLAELKPYVLEDGITLLDEGDEAGARLRFAALGGYKDATDYVIMIDTDDVLELIPYLDNKYAKEKAYGRLFNDYLTGTWQGEGYSFAMQEDRSISYDVPWFEFGSRYKIDDGIMVLENEEGETRNLYRFTMIDADTMDVYAYKDGNTYRLRRQ